MMNGSQRSKTRSTLVTARLQCKRADFFARERPAGDGDRRAVRRALAAVAVDAVRDGKDQRLAKVGPTDETPTAPKDAPGALLGKGLGRKGAEAGKGRTRTDRLRRTACASSSVETRGSGRRVSAMLSPFDSMSKTRTLANSSLHVKASERSVGKPGAWARYRSAAPLSW